MIAYIHANTIIRDYGMEARNFGIIRKFIRTLLSMVQLGSGRLKMVDIKTSHMSTISGLYFLKSKFPCLELFRYLPAVVFVSNLCSFSIFLVFSISVIYLTIFCEGPCFSRCFNDVCYLPHCFVYLLHFVVLLHCSVSMVFR